MGKLYWKTFLLFWFSMILFITATAFVSDYVIKQKLIPLKTGNTFNDYANSAVFVYESAGSRGLHRWMRRMNHKYNISSYLIDEDKQDVLGRRLPLDVQDLANRSIRDKRNSAGYRSDNMFISPVLTTDSGKQYRFLVHTNRQLPPPAKQHLTQWWVQITLAILIAGMVCYLLSLYVTKPIRKLQQASKRLGEGQFDTRVSPLMGNRRDEIAQLAKDFDNMAMKIETLMGAHQRFLQDVSHEIRTPLARLQVALELAKRGEDNGEDALVRIATEIERIDDLVGEIMSLSRLQDNGHIHKNKLDLNLLLKEIIDDTSFEYSESDKQAQFESKTDCVVNGDIVLLRRALENIVRNGLRYCKHSVIVSLKQSQQIVITISDDGPGVPEQACQDIFKAFYRVDEARNQESGGYGLGLAIAKQAIELHHGTIKSQLNEQGGLQVIITLPK